MKEPVFTGSAVALVTPFRNYKIDYEKFGELIEYHIKNGSDAIVVCATTGESPTQTTEEHLEAVGFCVSKAAGRIKIIAGTGSNDTVHAVHMCRTAQSMGADGLLMVTPYYNKTTQRGLIKHYLHVADRVDIPIILYNVPSRTGLAITAETYAELSKHPLINGTKEASGNIGLVAETLSLCGDEFNFWSGNDEDTVAIMSLGGKGVISVVANILPAESAKMCALALNNDFPAAAKMQIGLMKLIKALFIEVNPIPIKTAMNLMGFDVGELRMPLCEMSEKNLETLTAVLREYGLLK
ncbi:MAG: 4-hydroxy-tetrahydrodipicolinate synthase [Clostridiales bacterium]|nr:4-hydroxy-tetrahydrodipicolinate synthase [Clostridiales bacterium]